MSTRKSQNQQSSEPTTGKTIYLISPSKVQNELIANCLERKIGVKCLLGKDISHISYDGEGTGQRGLILLDCQGKDPGQLLIELKSLNNPKSSGYQVVLFNVSPDLKNEEKYVWEGVAGFVYDQDPTDRFLQGVQTVLNGEMWFSRGTMTKCIVAGREGVKSSEPEASALSFRQVEILALAAVGVTNEQIAEKLCISPHTVKTHLYNIFKKIDVPNRLQAALWAAKNL